MRGKSYDYVEGVDGQPGSFDYDDPRDYEEWCDWNDVNIEEDIMIPSSLRWGESLSPPGMLSEWTQIL